MDLSFSHPSPDTKQARERNTQQPISNLGPEVLTKIFQHVAEHEGITGVSRINLVCFGFAEAVKSNPALWAYINATKDTLEGVRAALNRSKGLPLHISGYPGANKDVNAELLVEAKRWASLKLGAAQADKLDTIDLPALRSFEAAFNDTESFGKAMSNITTPDNVHYAISVPWGDEAGDTRFGYQSSGETSTIGSQLAHIAGFSHHGELDLTAEKKADKYVIELFSSCKDEGSFDLAITCDESDMALQVLNWIHGEFNWSDMELAPKLVFRGFDGSLIGEDYAFLQWLEQNGWATALKMESCSTEFVTAVLDAMSGQGEETWYLPHIAHLFIGDSFPDYKTLVKMFKKRKNDYVTVDREDEYLPDKIEVVNLDPKWKVKLSSKQITALETTAGAAVIRWNLDSPAALPKRQAGQDGGEDEGDEE